MTAPFRVERLGAQDRSTFSSGSAPLDKYLREQAGQDVKRQVAVCYVAIEEGTGRLAGYYTLAAASIALLDLPAELQRKLPRYPSVPAARIGRLAVDQASQGQGLGAALLDHALETVLRSGMGVYAVIVDAKDAAAARFYERLGFRRLERDHDRHPPVLFLPMRTVGFERFMGEGPFRRPPKRPLRVQASMRPGWSVWPGADAPRAPHAFPTPDEKRCASTRPRLALPPWVHQPLPPSGAGPCRCNTDAELLEKPRTLWRRCAPGSLNSNFE